MSTTFPFEAVFFLGLCVTCGWCFILAIKSENHSLSFGVGAIFCFFMLVCISVDHVNERAYEQGKKAATMKISANANPYVSDTMAGPKWLEGYMETMKSQN